MKSKKYSLTLTDETFATLNSLERKGYNVRNVLNAGVILFDETAPDDRGRPILTAFGKLQQELSFVEKKLERVLDWINARKGKGAMSAKTHQSAEQLQQALDAVTDITAYPPGTEIRIIVASQSEADEFSKFRKLHGHDTDKILDAEQAAIDDENAAASATKGSKRKRSRRTPKSS